MFQSLVFGDGIRSENDSIKASDTARDKKERAHYIKENSWISKKSGIGATFLGIMPSLDLLLFNIGSSC